MSKTDMARLKEIRQELRLMHSRHDRDALFAESINELVIGMTWTIEQEPFKVKKGKR